MWQRVRRFLWDPKPEAENSAQTLVRVLGNWVRSGFTASVVLVFGAWAAIAVEIWWEDRPRRLTSLGGVEIGMRPVDVTLVKGAPATGGPKEHAEGLWVQGMIYDRMVITLRGSSENSLSVERVCDYNHSPYTSFIGISGSDSESSVQKRLGKPSREVIHEDGLTKDLEFARYNVMIRFQQAKVQAFCVGINDD